MEILNKINYPIKYVEYKRLKKEINEFYKIYEDIKNKKDLEFMRNLK